VRRGSTIGRFIFSAFLVVLLSALAAMTVLTSKTVEHLYAERIQTGLLAQAGLARMLFPDTGGPPDTAAAAELCARVRAETGARVTLVLPSGEALADTDRPPEGLDNHADRPEIRGAMESGAGVARRRSGSLGGETIYAAVAVPRPPAMPAAVLRLAVPATEMRAALGRLRFFILAIGASAALLAVLASALVARRISGPLNAVKAGMLRYAQGDFSRPVRVSRPGEIASLCEAMNAMAARLDDRIRTVVKERNQQEAILSSMVEGVIAVDTEGRVVSHNEAAVRLTGIPLTTGPDAHLARIAPGSPLSQFVTQILTSPAPRESEFGSLSQGGRILQVHGSVLRDAAGSRLGAVVVLNDVTRLRRLEQVRRDFVANVSHELRTPVTSIKGFVETLLDGAIGDPEEARRFLEIVAKQSDRLNAILNDLLTLSRIEGGEERASIEMETVALRDILENAVQLCAKKAAAREVAVELDCDPVLRARVNAPLLEQAVANLVENAVKFSPAGSRVTVRGQAGEEIVVRVEDQGCGIAPEHLPRLFERFYRVDKARSRSLGGTGLGLAIASHVVTAHGGRVGVTSTPGAGSVFSLYLPPVSGPPAPGNG